MQRYEISPKRLFFTGTPCERPACHPTNSVKAISVLFIYFYLLFVYTHTHNRSTALWIMSGTTRVSLYQKKHSPTVCLQ